MMNFHGEIRWKVTTGKTEQETRKMSESKKKRERERKTFTELKILAKRWPY
jgi:hypothetical protein